jgi:hypothetical protein
MSFTRPPRFGASSRTLAPRIGSADQTALEHIRAARFALAEAERGENDSNELKRWTEARLNSATALLQAEDRLRNAPWWGDSMSNSNTPPPNAGESSHSPIPTLGERSDTPAPKRANARVVFPTPCISEDDPALLAFVDDLAAYFADKYLAGQMPKKETDK